MKSHTNPAESPGDPPQIQADGVRSFFRACGITRTLLPASLFVLSVTGLIGLAPTETTMGHAQRVLYIHVSVAWLSLLGFIVVAAAGLMYLIRRDLWWDRWAQATAELGWLCACMTLMTGSLWAHSAWGTWWTWDPRLVTSFILWALYGAYLITRGNLDDPHGRARIAAVLAVFSSIDVPLVIMATRWFRALHPVAPRMEPSMRLVLMCTVVGVGVFTTLLVVCRRNQLQVENTLGELARQMDL
jgi:heme exporter protein C